MNRQKKQVCTKCHQQPQVEVFTPFQPSVDSLERYTLSVYRAGEIDLFENLDIVHIRLLVVPSVRNAVHLPQRATQAHRMAHPPRTSAHEWRCFAEDVCVQFAVGSNARIAVSRSCLRAGGYRNALACSSRMMVSLFSLSASGSGSDRGTSGRSAAAQEHTTHLSSCSGCRMSTTAVVHEHFMWG